jgi:hypothetical protein
MQKYIAKLTLGTITKEVEIEARDAQNAGVKTRIWLKANNLYGKVHVEITAKNKINLPPIKKLTALEIAAAEKLAKKEKQLAEFKKTHLGKILQFMNEELGLEITEEIVQLTPEEIGKLAENLQKEKTKREIELLTHRTETLANRPQKIVRPAVYKILKKNKAKRHWGLNFASANNPRPKYNKKKHQEKFMVVIERLRAGKGMFAIEDEN